MNSTNTFTITYPFTFDYGYKEKLVKLRNNLVGWLSNDVTLTDDRGLVTIKIASVRGFSDAVVLHTSNKTFETNMRLTPNQMWELCEIVTQFFETL
jgi:hypothetical protein